MQRRWYRKCIRAARMTNGFCSLFATTASSVWNPPWFSYFSFYHVGWCSCHSASCRSASWSCTTHSWTRPVASPTHSKGRAEAAAERIDQRDSQGGRCHSNSHSCVRHEPWACQGWCMSTNVGHVTACAPVNIFLARFAADLVSWKKPKA